MRSHPQTSRRRCRADVLHNRFIAVEGLAAGQLRYGTQLYTYHEDKERIESAGKTTEKGVQNGDQDFQGGLRYTIARTS